MSYKTYLSEYCPLSAESSDCAAEKSIRSVGVLILSRLYWFDTDSAIGIDIIHISLPSFCILECVFVCVYFMGPCVVRPLFIHFGHGTIKDVAITCCWCSKRLFSRSLTKIFCSLFFFFLLSSAALTCSPNHRWVWLETHCDSYFVWGKSFYFAVVVQYSQVVMVCEDKKIEVIPSCVQDLHLRGPVVCD